MPCLFWELLYFQVFQLFQVLWKHLAWDANDIPVQVDVLVDAQEHVVEHAVDHVKDVVLEGVLVVVRELVILVVLIPAIEVINNFS